MAVVPSRLALGPLLALAGGCNPHPVEAAAAVETFVEVSYRTCASAPTIDVLLVIDDSPSMHDHVETVAENLREFAQVYDPQGWDIDVRIAVTTTDMGNPACDPATIDDGALVSTSCRQRPEQFVTEATIESDAADVTEPGCRTFCPYESLPIVPTEVAGTPMRPRPWLERTHGVWNLAPGTEFRDALPCLGSVGVSGCAFESPLAAAQRAIERSADENDPAYGFLRPLAWLDVVFIGDEDDCSVRAEHGDVFEPGGDRALWSDPDAPEATSAVCWNAGVSCIGDPQEYDSCDPADRGPDGQLVASQDAVLHPPSESIAFFRALGEYKRSFLPWPPHGPVWMSAASGLDADGTLTFSRGRHPESVLAYGVDPGCVTSKQTAYPSPRLREVVEAFSFPGINWGQSICNEDWGPSLTGLSWGAQTPPRWQICLPDVPIDADPSTPPREPACVVEQRDMLDDGSPRTSTLPHCDDVDEGEPCWWLEGRAHPYMDYRCTHQGASFELKVRDLWPTTRGTCLTLTCSVEVDGVLEGVVDGPRRGRES